MGEKLKGSFEEEQLSRRDFEEFIGQSPFVEVRFKTDNDMSNAWSLIPAQRPVVGLPDRGMVVDIGLLRRFQQAGIPLYPSDQK